MSDLKCNVGNCINNQHGLCCRPIIKVDGDNAQKSCDTFCHSFNHRVNSFENSVIGKSKPEEYTDVKCSAAECSYNTESRCTAQTVEICGNGACRSGETECSTFKRR